jgi:hypothetical protein
MRSDEIDDIEVGNYYEDQDEMLAKENIKELSDVELKRRLMIMKTNFDYTSKDPLYLEAVYKKEINDFMKRKILKSRLFDNSANQSASSNTKSNMIGNKRDRSTDQKQEDIFSGRRQPSNAPNMTSANIRGSVNQSVQQASSAVDNTVFNHLGSSMHSSKSLPSVTRSIRLSRADMINSSIRRTSLTDSQLVNQDQGKTSFKWKKELIEVLVTLGSLLIVYLLYKRIEVNELNFAKLQSLLDWKIVLLGLLLIAAVIIIYLLWEKQKQAVLGKNKLIATNCIDEIKKFLQEKSPDFMTEEDFVKVYCHENEMNEEKFRQDILPLMKECFINDSELEETHMNLEGGMKVIWRLK